MKLSASVVCGLCVFSSALLGCSRPSEDAPLIIGGRVDREPDSRSRGADPAVLAIHAGGWLCTGTLIAPRFALTARHCVEDNGRTFEGGFVTFGLRSDEGARTRVKVHLPPRQLGYAGDIAVLELAEPSTVTPIPVFLGSGLDRVGEIRVVGYGVTGESKHDSGTKRTASVRAHTTPSYVESSGTDGTCYGDSGGPALATIDGREQIVGVTSHGHGNGGRCEGGTRRYVRTDIHHAFLRPFLVGAPSPSPSPFPSPMGDGVASNSGSAGTASAGTAGSPGASGDGVAVASSSENGVTIVTTASGSGSLVRITTTTPKGTTVTVNGVELAPRATND